MDSSADYLVVHTTAEVYTPRTSPWAIVVRGVLLRKFTAHLSVLSLSALLLLIIFPISTHGTTVQINAGGPAWPPFLADQDFTASNTISHLNSIDTTKASKPAPVAVYQTGRIGNFTYTIGGFVAGSNATVRLHFAETYWSDVGQRLFNVSINGKQVLTSFDIFAAAGGQNIANIQQFTATANASGQYVIQFTTIINKSLVNGIEIASSPSCTTPTPPSALSATGTSSSQISTQWTASSSPCPGITYTIFRSTTAG